MEDRRRAHVEQYVCDQNLSLHVAEQFAIHDAALSSEESGDHTPAINTPVSAFCSLPAAPSYEPCFKDSNPPATVFPLLPPSSLSYSSPLQHSSHILHPYPHIDYPVLSTIHPGVPDNHPFLLQHHSYNAIHDMTIPTNHRPSHIPSPTTPAFEHERADFRGVLSTSLHLLSHSASSLAGAETRLEPMTHPPPPSTKREASPTPPVQSDEQADNYTGAPTNPTASHRTARNSSGMVIACKQCRSRKIRCDSTRPICNNCTRRCSTCEYDAAPKRRGPDKRPGTRQRTCKKKANEEVEPPSKRRKGTDTSPINSPTISSMPHPANSKVESPINNHTSQPSPAILSPQSPSLVENSSLPLYPPPSHSASSSHSVTKIEESWKTAVDSGNDRIESTTLNVPGKLFNAKPVNHTPSDGNAPLSLVTPPSVQYSRKAWWEDLLNNYLPNQSPSASLQAMVDDLSFLFSTTSYWLACFNVPVFLRNICDPVEREQLQPSLILSGLALATLMKSSEIGLGEKGREKALYLRDAAQGTMEASFHAQWIDPTLAQAALILALFEASAHPKHTPQRAASSLMYLDSIIRTLALASLDADNPETSVFPPKAVPAVPRESLLNGSRQCSCETSPMTAISVNGQTSSGPLGCAPGWDPTWSKAEVRREESRRLCWSALTLVAAHTADCAAVRGKPLDLYLIKPSNYGILFPGEILTCADKTHAPHPPKESVWALYCRSMLLWNSCGELSHDDISDSEKAEFAMQAWMEADIIEDALNNHICSAEQASLYVGRDYLLNTRMTITQEFRRFMPLPVTGSHPFFSRKKAEEWLKYQRRVARTVKSTLHLLSEGQGKVLASRPFYVWWFMGQIAISMSLWQYDPSFTEALEICHEYLAPIDVLTYLWPCSAQRVRYMALRDKLNEASLTAGLTPPPAPNFAIPSQPLV